MVGKMTSAWPSGFFCVPELRFNDETGLKLEFAYLLRSYNIPQYGSPDIIYSFGVYMPTAIVQYIVLEPGYAVKFGGGLGYHVAKFAEENLPGEKQYTSTGIGMRLDAETNISFDDHVFGSVVVDLRNEIMSEFRSPDGVKMLIKNRNKAATMNFFSLGLKLGLMYYL